MASVGALGLDVARSALLLGVLPRTPARVTEKGQKAPVFQVGDE